MRGNPDDGVLEVRLGRLLTQMGLYNALVKLF